MGQFSFITADTGRSIVAGKMENVYLLVPPAFQSVYGTAICEHCYDGYGRFGTYDVYELVALWNREMIPEIIRRIENGTWAEASETDISMLEAYQDGDMADVRDVGILMAGMNENNFALEYPIKITSVLCDYTEVPPSVNDPLQGCTGMPVLRKVLVPMWNRYLLFLTDVSLELLGVWIKEAGKDMETFFGQRAYGKTKILLDTERDVHGMDMIHALGYDEILSFREKKQEEL